MTGIKKNEDHISVCLETVVFIKVHDISTYKMLKNIKNNLKINSTTVQCDLGENNFCHLGLVLSDLKYTTVTVVLYLQSLHP